MQRLLQNAGRWCSGAVAGILVVCAVFVPGASAAESGSISFSSTGFTIRVIRCDWAIDHPHISSHVPENVNVVAHITCTSPVDSITVDTKLFRGVVQVGSGHSVTPFAGFGQGNAAAPCITASYTGSVRFSVVPPVGYVPNPAVANGANVQSFPITC